MNMLVSDYFFPTKYSKWRILLCENFIKTFNADILTYVPPYIASLPLGFTVDWKELYEQCALVNYNIYIFDKRYNYLQKYNSDGVDGTKYNGVCAGSFLLRHKSKGEFNIHDYNCIYHIMISNYFWFARTFRTVNSKHIIHCYPGGGLAFTKKYNLPKNVYIIMTHHFTKKLFARHPSRNKITTHGPYLGQYEKILDKPEKSKEDIIRVCFTSHTGNITKGIAMYIQICNKYLKLYSNDNIEFCSITPHQLSPEIKHFEPMAQNELDSFYYDNIDILIMPVHKKYTEGWPQGGEAAVQGVVLFVNDWHNSNSKNEFNFGDEVFIMNGELDKTISHLKLLHDDKSLLHQYSIQIKNKAYDLWNYQQCQGSINNFINMLA